MNDVTAGEVMATDWAKLPTTQQERDFHRQMLNDIVPNAATKAELAFPQRWVQMWINFDMRLMAEIEPLIEERNRYRAAATIAHHYTCGSDETPCTTDNCDIERALAGMDTPLSDRIMQADGVSLASPPMQTEESR